MSRKVRLVAGIAAALLVTAFVVSCDDDDDITGPGANVRVYTANAFGTQEVGANGQLAPTGNPGTAVAVFVDNTTRIDWTLTLNNITAVIQSHIHGPALPNANANVIFDLYIPATATGPLTNFTTTGSITGSAAVSLDSLRTLFNNGRAYVNVHTTPIPAGAIRGQVVRTN
jgi:CHRD domain-containing protein